LPHVFELFVQVDRSLEREQTGLGIGLTLVRQLVTMHGGKIEARSEGPGKGSEFVVRLPLAKTTTARAPMRVPSLKAAAASKRRILLVDDNKDSAFTMSMLLRMHGHDTFTAHDGHEAMSAAEQFRPEAVLLDIGLPKMNGYDVCRRIREQPWGKEIILVAVTGWGQEDDKRRSHEAGFNHHLVKPVDHAALMQLLGDL
jgi:CheY-like chemotaxis protein